MDVGESVPLTDAELLDEEGEDLCASPPTRHAQRERLLPFENTPLYSPSVDSTLGYTGEGPQALIASYNINGVKSRLRDVLRAANESNLDALLLQVVHFHQDGLENPHLGMRSLCRGYGWLVFLAPASSTDVKGGTAILIKENSS
jgi:hypothetical protein